MQALDYRVLNVYRMHGECSLIKTVKFFRIISIFIRWSYLDNLDNLMIFISFGNVHLIKISDHPACRTQKLGLIEFQSGAP